jgi:hypothetical protein
MPAGLSVALVLAAQAAAQTTPMPAQADGPVPTAASIATPTVPLKDAQRECTNPPAPDPNSREIVVCAVKPNGYRLDPDVLAARRLKKKGESVRPRNPHENYADHSCATVGPMGCRGQPTIDIVTAAAALATMADRLSKGQEIGSMFETTPAKGEYQLYLEAKKEREAAEADKAAKAKAAAAQAAADGGQTRH